MGFNARPLVFYGILGGNIKAPPKKVLRNFLGHLSGSFWEIKKCPLGTFLGRFLCHRELSRDQKSAQESSLKSALENPLKSALEASLLKKCSIANALNA